MAVKKKEVVVLSAEERADARRKQKQAELAVLKLNTRSVHIGEDTDDSDEIYIPTGVVEIDALLGDRGGLRPGTVAEFYGQNASGKSFVALKTIATAQKMGIRSALMNVEYSYNDARAQAIGINTRDADTFELYEGLGFAENWAKWIWKCAKSGEYGIIVVDSLSSFIPQDTYTKDLDKVETIGIFSKFIGRFTNRLVEICGETGTTVILINQMRYKSVKVGTKVEFVLAPMGGEGPGFWTSVRMQFRKVGGVDGQITGSNSKIVGGRSQIHLVKSRQGTPNTKAVFPIYFGKNEGDPIKDFLHRAVNNQSIKDRGNITLKLKVYRYIDPATGEVMVQTKDGREFINGLINSPAPSVPIRGDVSTTGFEFVCGRLNLSQMQVDEIVKALEVISTEDDNETDMHELDEDDDFYADPVIA